MKIREYLNEARGDERTKDIRDFLKKEFKLTNRDVGVRYDGSIRLTLKTVKALPYMKKIEEAARKHESYQRDERTGDILRGGNTFVFIDLDWKFREKLVKQIYAEVMKKVDDTFMNGEGGGNTIDIYGDYSIFKDRQSQARGKDEFHTIHKKQSSAGPPQYDLMSAAGRVLHLMLKHEDEKNLKKLK
jgi:hypothetical protein